MDIVRVEDSFGATSDATVEVVAIVSDVDYAIPSNNFPTEGSTGAVFGADFDIQNIGSADGTRTISWACYLSTDTSVDEGDSIAASGTNAPLESGALTKVSFSGIWPDSYGAYYLIVVISAADDDVGTNNTVDSGPIPLGLGDGGEAAEAEPNGAWDPNSGDFGWGWIAEANDFGIVLNPGMTITITGNIETDGADIFKFNAGTVNEISVSVTWNGGNTIDAPLHDAIGPELEGIYADSGFEAYTYSSVIADGYADSDLYITIGNDTVWNGLPGNGIAYTLTIQGL